MKRVVRGVNAVVRFGEPIEKACAVDARATRLRATIAFARSNIFALFSLFFHP
jgi:hypothetical protein